MKRVAKRIIVFMLIGAMMVGMAPGMKSEAASLKLSSNLNQYDMFLTDHLRLGKC